MEAIKSGIRTTQSGLQDPFYPQELFFVDLEIW